MWRQRIFRLVGRALLTLALLCVNLAVWFGLDYFDWGKFTLRHNCTLCVHGFSADSRHLITYSGSDPREPPGAPPRFQRWNLGDRSMRESIVDDSPRTFDRQSDVSDMWAISPDGTRCLCGSKKVLPSGRTQFKTSLVDLESQKILTTWPEALEQATFSADGQRASAILSWNNPIIYTPILIRANDGKKIALPSAFCKRYGSKRVWLSPDGSLLAMRCGRPTSDDLTIIDCNSGRELLNQYGPISDITFAHRVPLAAVVTRKTVELHRLGSVEPPKVFTISGDPREAFFSRDDQLFFINSAEGLPTRRMSVYDGPKRRYWIRMRCWEVATGKPFPGLPTENLYGMTPQTGNKDPICARITRLDGSEILGGDHNLRSVPDMGVGSAIGISDNGERVLFLDSRLPFGQYPIQIAKWLNVPLVKLPRWLIAPSRRARIVETFTGKTILTMPDWGVEGSELEVTLSPDGLRVAALKSDGDSTIQFFDAEIARRQRGYATLILLLTNVMGLGLIIVYRRRRACANQKLSGNAAVSIGA